jgi:hypothetical protein
MYVRFGSTPAGQSPARERPTTVHSGSLNQNPVGPFRVVSRRLAKSYIELVPTSEFGVTTDIRRTSDHGHAIGLVLLSSANNGPLDQTKTAARRLPIPGKQFIFGT